MCLFNKKTIAPIIIVLCLFALTSCPNHKADSLVIKFHFTISNEGVELYELKYSNKAGNSYMINDIQMIISKIRLIRENGEIITFPNEVIHYVDIKDTASLTWLIPLTKEEIYQSVELTFGLDDTLNISGTYKNPPISDMFWPDILGGGYHFLKLNCKWHNPETLKLEPFNFHIGRLVFEGDTTNTHFKMVYKNIDNFININIDISEWFENPNEINFSKYTNTSVMQNKDLQLKAKENGKNGVFTQK